MLFCGWIHYKEDIRTVPRMQIKCRDTNEIVHSYSGYLKTRHWNDLRSVAFEKAGGVCRCCKKPLKGDFVVHHKTYRRVGRERINHKFFRDDVVAVCPRCHDGESKQHAELHEFVRVPWWARIEQ